MDLKRVAILLAAILVSAIASAQTYEITSYCFGTVNGASAENLNNSAARRRNTIYSEITYGRKMPVKATVSIDEESGRVLFQGPETKLYEVDFDAAGRWDNVGRKRKFISSTGKDPSNNLPIVFERIADSDGVLVQVSVFAGGNVVTYDLTQVKL